MDISENWFDASTDELLPFSGDKLLPFCGDELLRSSGDKLLPSSGDELLRSSGDKLLLSSGDGLLPSKKEILPLNEKILPPTNMLPTNKHATDNNVLNTDKFVPPSTDEQHFLNERVVQNHLNSLMTNVQTLAVAVQTLTDTVQTLGKQIMGLEKQITDLVQQQRIQKVIERVTLPFCQPDTSLFNRARATNLALRQHIPIAFVKSERASDIDE